MFGPFTLTTTAQRIAGPSASKQTKAVAVSAGTNICYFASSAEACDAFQTRLFIPALVASYDLYLGPGESLWAKTDAGTNVVQVHYGST